MSKEVYTTDFTQLGLQPLEVQVLSQYQLLASQLKTLNGEITKLNSTAEEYKESSDSVTAEDLLDNLRHLEKRLGLVYTFFQGAVYQLFLQNEVNDVTNDGIDPEGEDQGYTSHETNDAAT